MVYTVPQYSTQIIVDFIQQALRYKIAPSLIGPFGKGILVEFSEWQSREWSQRTGSGVDEGGLRNGSWANPGFKERTLWQTEVCQLSPFLNDRVVTA
jgi:hypothetical protein